MHESKKISNTYDTYHQTLIQRFASSVQKTVQSQNSTKKFQRKLTLISI